MKFLYFLLLSLLFCAQLSAQNVPAKPKSIRYVADIAKLLTNSERETLDELFYQFELGTKAQIVVVIVKSLQGADIESYAAKLFKQWGIGDKKRNDGALLLIAQKDRKMRIEVGYGLEDRLTDGRSARIISDILAPNFKNEQFYKGLDEAAQELMYAIAPSFPSPKVKRIGEEEAKKREEGRRIAENQTGAGISYNQKPFSIRQETWLILLPLIGLLYLPLSLLWLRLWVRDFWQIEKKGKTKFWGAMQAFFFVFSCLPQYTARANDDLLDKHAVVFLIVACAGFLYNLFMREPRYKLAFWSWWWLFFSFGVFWSGDADTGKNFSHLWDDFCLIGACVALVAWGLAWFLYKFFTTRAAGGSRSRSYSSAHNSSTSSSYKDSSSSASSYSDKSSYSDYSDYSDKSSSSSSSSSSYSDTAFTRSTDYGGGSSGGGGASGSW